jgi:hypothetical protein
MYQSSELDFQLYERLSSKKLFWLLSTEPKPSNGGRPNKHQCFHTGDTGPAIYTENRNNLFFTVSLLHVPLLFSRIGLYYVMMLREGAGQMDEDPA